MNKKSIGIMLSVILGGTVLFAGYKTIEKREDKKKNEISSSVVENDRNDKNDEKLEDLEDEKDDDFEVEDNDDRVEENKKPVVNNKPATNNKPTNNNKPVVNNKVEDNDDDTIGIYKKGVTEGEVEALKDKYEEKSNFRYIYGTAFSENGGGPIYETGRELEGAKMFYGEVDTTLNELWGDLRKILKPDVYKRLQQNQVEWIKERDRIASTVGKPGDVVYIDKQGRETCKRIRYLIDNYLD
ncbi:MAG: lysozyme inhibitor LprI family protein [Clostridium sp.]|uniref:lysozyme inhibitor LprI family protein n=1 Tax=Clostridium sp. TaxID=1506 RepID=UPI003F37DFAE